MTATSPASSPNGAGKGSPVTERFAAGTFRPHPRRSSPVTMLLAQARMETLLVLRHSEQLLLTMAIPLALLIGLSLLPLDALPDPQVARVVPATLTVSVMSAGFTGQAIAVAFDRRYGALRRLGATALPQWCIIGGKILAVLSVAMLQILAFSSIGFVLGWRPGVEGFLALSVITLLGALVFTTLGLLLGGTCKAEVVLGLANLLWFVLMALTGVVLIPDSVHTSLHVVALLTPSGALTAASMAAVAGGVHLGALLVLVVWGLIGSVTASRLFRFS